MSNTTAHLAVIRLSAMGDVAMTVPVLRALTHKYPQLKITVISRPFFKPFFREINNVDFLNFDTKGRHKGFIGILKLFQEIRSLKINAFADLHHVLRTIILRNLFALSGIKTAHVDKARAAKKALTRANNKIFEPLPSIFDRQIEVFAKLGYPVDLKDPIFPVKPQLSSQITANTGIKNQKWIGIAPFAQYKSKVYPLDLMENLILQLSADPNYRIFLFGGGSIEKEQLEQFVSSNVINVAGKFNLDSELDLIANLDLMISMDSGNAHIAAMLGIPVLTLWGATHPYAGFLPFNQPLENAITSNREQFPKIPTSIYGKKMIPGYEDAMRTISVTAILDKINTIV